MMLVQAAANDWKVPASEARRQQHHHPYAVGQDHDLWQGRRGAAKLTAGRRQAEGSEGLEAGRQGVKRLDTAGQGHRHHVYGIDVKLPACSTPRSRIARSRGGKLKSYDEARSPA